MEGIPVDVTQKELQEQLDNYFENVRNHIEIPV